MDLIKEVVTMLSQSLSAVSNWFLAIIEAVGGSGFYLTMVFIVLLFGYLLAPVLGSSRGSDKASKRKEDE